MAGSKQQVIQAREGRVGLIAGWLGMLVFLVLICIFAPTHVPVGSSWNNYIFPAVIALIFISSLYRLVVMTLSLRRFGNVTLHLHDVPRAGGTLAAHLEIPGQGAVHKAEVKLICYEVSWSHSNTQNNTRQETERWSRVLSDIPVNTTAQGGRIAFKFEIPPDLPATTEPTGPAASGFRSHEFGWRLKLEARVPGVNLVRTYDLHVSPADPSTVATAAAKSATGAGAPRGTPTTLSALLGMGPVAKGTPWLTPSACVLIAANLVPVAGVLFFGWELLPVLLLFWMENVIVGLFYVLRLMTAGQGAVKDKIGLTIFFMFHYGFFCLIHGTFVLALFGKEILRQYGLDVGLVFPTPLIVSTIIARYHLLPGVLSLFVSHGFSYFHNYLGANEYRDARPNRLMFMAYPRVVVLHMVILVGGFTLLMLGSPAVLLVVLVVLKTALDVIAHRYEHVRHAAAVEEGVAAGARSRPLPTLRMAMSALAAVCVAAGICLTWPKPAARLSPQALVAIQQAYNSPRPRSSRPSHARIRTHSKNTAPQSARSPEYAKAVALYSQGHAAEAERALQALLASVQSSPSGPPPEAALVLEKLAEIHLAEGRNADYERNMERALAVLEPLNPAMAKTRLEANGARFDKESLARELGDYFRKQRQYKKSMTYYSLANHFAPQIEVTDAERNRRLAFSAEGMMAMACAAGYLAAAQNSMQELDKRMQTVDAASRAVLARAAQADEPQVKAGHCGTVNN